MSPDCQKCRQYISAYLDGETTRPEEQFIRNHTQTCPECREALRAYQGIRTQFQTLSHPVPPAALRQAVLVGLRNGGRVSGGRNRGSVLAGGFFGRSLNIGMGLVTAAIVFIIAVAVLVASIVAPTKTEFDVVPVASDQLPSGGNTVITLTFTKPVDETELRKHLTTDPPVKVEVVGDGTVARLTPIEDLTPNQTVNISIEGLRDKNNEPLKNNKVELTYKVVDPTATVMPPSATPKRPTPTQKPNPGQVTTVALPTNPPNTPKPNSNPTVVETATPMPPPVATATVPPIATTKPAATTTVAKTTASPPVTPEPGPTVTTTLTVTITPTTTIKPGPTVTATTTTSPGPTVTDTTTPAPTVTATTTVATTPTPTTTLTPTTIATTPPVATTTAVPGAACAIPPVSGFGLVYKTTPGLPVKMGCPTEHEHNILMAYRAFEYGFMFYEHETEQIWVFYNKTGAWEVYANDNAANPPASYGTNPPPGKYEPDRGFGKVWYNYKLQSRLGFSTQPSEYTNALGAAQAYERGLMLFTPGGEPDGHKHVYVLYGDNTFLNVVDKN